jgi:hypothetical protein
VDSGKNKHEKNSFMLWLSRIRKETFKTIKTIKLIFVASPLSSFTKEKEQRLVGLES